jgi:uncharacterized damage-inducible protein DinB
MTNREFCIARRESEFPAFVRVLKAIPSSPSDYRPDPKSRTAAELAWLLAAEEAALGVLMETGVIDWKEEKPPAGLAETIAAYERNAAAVDARLAGLDDAAWEKPAKFLMGGVAVWEGTVCDFFWGFLFDAVHHRGQLSTYLRAMGGKVPSIYGPSADENG